MCRRAALKLPDGARAFLERPGIAGLARLVAVDRGAGALVYASGEVWSAAEVIASPIVQAYLGATADDPAEEV